MKRISLLCLFLAAPAAQAFDSVSAIMKHYSSQRIEALNTYIAEHPDAPDVARAYDALIDGYVIQEDYKQAIGFLEKKYDLLNKAAELDMQGLFGEIVPTHAVLSLEAGMRAEGKAFLERVKTDFKDHEAADQINQMLAQWSMEFSLPGLGETMDIAFKPVNGKKEVSTKSLKGKVVLVDFWATWCGPCVAAIPELKAAYDKYHDKGFEILGISGDQNEKALTSFIQKENLDWPQVLDNSLDESILARFGITRFPTTFLLDKEGKIVAVDPHGDELTAHLEKLL